MKSQDLIVSCIYANEGKAIKEVIQTSSSSFFSRELEKGVSVSINRV